MEDKMLPPFTTLEVKETIRDCARKLILMEKALKLNKVKRFQILSDQVTYDLRALKYQYRLLKESKNDRKNRRLPSKTLG